MWFEQFYSGIITTAFVAGACYMSYPFNKWDVGRAFRRNYCTVKSTEDLFLLDVSVLGSYASFAIELSQRDHRMTGNQYRISGLESIRD